MIVKAKADLIRAAIDWKQMQIKKAGDTEFRNCDMETAVRTLASDSADEVRVRPADSVIINGIECPAPLYDRGMLLHYFSLDLDSWSINRNPAKSYIQKNNKHAESCCEYGIAFRSAEDAWKAFNAMTKPLRDYVTSKRGWV